MSRIFAWILAVFSVAMLAVQIFGAARTHLTIVGFWALILMLCLYQLFFKNKAKSAEPE